MATQRAAEYPRWRGCERAATTFRPLARYESRAVAQRQCAIGERRGRARMRDQDAASLLGAYALAQELDHAGGRRRVEVSGGLVGEDDRRAVHERARDGDTLHSPPESSRGMLAPRSPSPTASSMEATRSSRSIGARASSASGTATFCATVRYGSTWKA